MARMTKSAVVFFLVLSLSTIFASNRKNLTEHENSDRLYKKTRLTKENDDTIFAPNRNNVINYENSDWFYKNNCFTKDNGNNIFAPNRKNFTEHENSDRLYKKTRLTKENNDISVNTHQNIPNFKLSTKESLELTIKEKTSVLMDLYGGMQRILKDQDLVINSSGALKAMMKKIEILRKQISDLKTEYDNFYKTIY